MRRLACTGLLLLLASPLAAQGEKCLFSLDHVEREGAQVKTPDGTNYFAGGDVRISCVGLNVHMRSDSVAWYGGQGVLQFIGAVRYQDTTITMDADRGTYYRQGERWEARGHVVTRNLENGSTLTGPALDYYRAIKGQRDTLEMYAVGRPSIKYIPVDSAGRPAEPYRIVGDRVRFKGEDRIWAGGRVTVDRSDFAARADSMRLDTGAGSDGSLIGSPVIRGLGADSFNLTGRRIELGLADKELNRVRAQGNGHALTSDLDLRADTISLRLENHDLVETLAWGDSLRPFAHSPDYAIRADSLAFDTPGKVLTEARAFGGACVGSAPDCVVTTERDWMEGDSVLARFAQRDSAGQTHTVLQRIEAVGRARAFYRVKQDSSGVPGLNYSRGDTIVVTMRDDAQGGVDRVNLRGNVDGVQLDPLEQVPDSAAADSARAAAAGERPKP